LYVSLGITSPSNFAFVRWRFGIAGFQVTAF